MNQQNTENYQNLLNWLVSQQKHRASGKVRKSDSAQLSKFALFRTFFVVFFALFHTFDKYLEKNTWNNKISIY